MKSKISGKKIGDGIAAHAPRGQQIRQFILTKIMQGAWTPNARVPSEHDLMEQFNCARMTVHYALKELRDEGYLVRVRGVGTFVAPPHVHVAVFKLTDIADDAAALGQTHSLEVLSKLARRANQGEAREFKIAQGDPLFCSNVLHRIDGVPAQLEWRVVNGTALPDYLTIDFRQCTPFRVLMERVPYPDGKMSIRAVVPTPEERRWLKLPANSACLEVNRTTWSHGTVFAKTRVLIREPSDLSGKIAPPIGFAHASGPVRPQGRSTSTT